MTIVGFIVTLMGMKVRSFHHPDICPTVIRRRVCEEVCDLLVGSAEMLVTRGRSLLRSHYPTDAAYRSAMYRLRKAGLIAYRRTGGKTPVLKLTEKGEHGVSLACRRREPWPAKWNGIWYILAYDVPEKDRQYRETLREFLKDMRMGSLQKSVWVTPRDIRPEYDDLVKAAGVDEFSYLFESRTVLGRSANEIVHSAWDMHRLASIQNWYMEVYADNLKRLTSGQFSESSVITLAREELSAFVTAMHHDPFLPRPLWPRNYAGERAWQFHRDFARQLTRHV